MRVVGTAVGRLGEGVVAVGGENQAVGDASERTGVGRNVPEINGGQANSQDAAEKTEVSWWDTVMNGPSKSKEEQEEDKRKLDEILRYYGVKK